MPLSKGIPTTVRKLTGKVYLSEPLATQKELQESQSLVNHETLGQAVYSWGFVCLCKFRHKSPHPQLKGEEGEGHGASVPLSLGHIGSGFTRQNRHRLAPSFIKLVTLTPIFQMKKPRSQV